MTVQDGTAWDISVVTVNFTLPLSSFGSMAWPETDKVQGAEQ